MILSDYNPFLEKELRRMPIMDFNFRIITIKNNQTKQGGDPDGKFGK